MVKYKKPKPPPPFDNTKLTVNDVIHNVFRTTPSNIECIRKADEIRDKSSKIDTSKFIYDMSTQDIAAYLSCRVIYQDFSTYDVAKLLKYAINTTSSIDEDNTPVRMLLTGATGSGKTQTVKEVRNLLRMCKNQIHANAYIEYRFTSISDKGQSSTVTGASPGYIGFGQGETLHDKLVKACSHYNKIKQEIRHNITFPHLVLLFIDELDKADQSIMNPLNSLLSDGCIHDNKTGNIFTIPKSIKLIVCFTANFGADLMLKNRLTYDDHYDESKLRIRDELSSVRGYEECNIDRMGEIIPFFHPSKEHLRVILVKRFYDNLMNKKDTFSKKYGRVHIEDDILMKFIDAMVRKYENNRSIRDVVDSLDKAMINFLSQSFESFNEQCLSTNTVITLPLDPPAEMGFDSIPYSIDLTKDVLTQNNPNLIQALQNVENSRSLNQCLKRKDPVEFFSLSHPLMQKRSIGFIGHLSSNFNVIINQHNHHVVRGDPNLIRKYDQVVEENRTIKRSLRKLKGAIDNDKKIKKPSKEKLKRIINESSSIDRNNEDQDCNQKMITQQNHKKRSRSESSSSDHDQKNEKKSKRIKMIDQSSSKSQNGQQQSSSSSPTRHEKILIKKEDYGLHIMNRYHQQQHQQDTQEYSYEDEHEFIELDNEDHEKEDDTKKLYCSSCERLLPKSMYLELRKKGDKTYQYSLKTCSSCRRNQYRKKPSFEDFVYNH